MRNRGNTAQRSRQKDQRHRWWRVGGAVICALAVLGLVFATVTRAPLNRATTPSRQRRPSPEVVLGAAWPVAAWPVGHARAGAREVAGRFCRTYVAFLYGRIGENDIQGASAQLRRRLRRARVRVPPARAQRTPTVVQLRTALRSPSVVRASATVGDGDLAAYVITAVIERRAGRWLVNGLDPR